MKKLNPCAVCGGQVKKKRMMLDRIIDGHVYLFDKVPVLACTQCAEIWIPGKTAEWMDQVIQGRLKPTRKISIPVYLAAA